VLPSSATLWLELEAATTLVTSAAFRVMPTSTEALISEVFKRPVLWDHQNKGYHNRKCVDKEWNNISHKLGISSKYNEFKDLKLSRRLCANVDPISGD
jgi:hypothetical protein